MQPTNVVPAFTGPLAALQIPYMVTGSVAAVVYGEPRVTHDVDLVVALTTREQAAALCAAFPLDRFYCPPFEVVLDAMRRRQRGHFILVAHDTGFRADVYIQGADPLHRWAMERRVEVVVGADRLWVAPAEYVIVRKLEFYREGGSAKHLSDIRAMLRVSGEQIDRDAVRGWVERLGLTAQWCEVETG